MIPAGSVRRRSAGLTDGGCACAGRWQGALVAIKIVERALGNMDQEDENAREALVAASVSHPNVVKLLSCATFHMQCTSLLGRVRRTAPERKSAPPGLCSAARVTVSETRLTRFNSCFWEILS